MATPKKTEEVVYLPGDYILREGAQCDALFIVKEGQIEIFRLNQHKKRITMGIVRSGEYLGEMSLISDRPHSANAVALTKTICVKISSEALEEQLKNSPKWLTALTRGLVFKLMKTNDVLKRNGIVDESLRAAVQAIEKKDSTEAA